MRACFRFTLSLPKAGYGADGLCAHSVLSSSMVDHGHKAPRRDPSLLLSSDACLLVGRDVVWNAACCPVRPARGSSGTFSAARASNGYGLGGSELPDLGAAPVVGEREDATVTPVDLLPLY